MRVVMIGAARSVHGGVSAVVNNYYRAGLDKKVSLSYIPTMVDGSRIRKLMCAALAYLRFLIKLPAFDILHVHMAADASFYRKKIFIDTAAFFHKKILIHEHGGDFQSFYYEKLNDKGRAKVRRTLNKAGLFVTLSARWAEFFAPMVDKDKIVVLENAVFIPDKPKASYENHKLLFLGRICREKGIAELFDALEASAEKYPDIKLYLGGVWEDKELEIRAEALEEYVVYLGWIDEEEREKYMEECSVFVLPSYFEGQPVSLLEAMAKGMAIISTKVGGIPQMLQSGRDGLLVEPENTEALRKAIEFVLDDTDAKRYYGENARQRAAEAYDIKKRLNEMTALYIRLWNNESGNAPRKDDNGK